MVNKSFKSQNVKSLKGRMRKCGGPRVAHPCYRGCWRNVVKSEESFYYYIRGLTTKVDDLGVEFLSSGEEN
jgi:hypothetical protein